MNIQQIWDEMDRLTSLMAGRDIPKPRAEAWFKDGQRLQLSLWGSGVSESGIELFSVGTLDELIEQARIHIAALPNKADRDMREFQRKVAEVIDFGNDHGIDGQWLNPLVETARALATNALTVEAAR